ARTLALLAIAMYDANVACFDAKYRYWLLRPTHADDSIQIAEGVRLPNFPAYPSGHACGAGAAAEIVGALIPQARETVDAISDDAAMSRLYAGVHYRFDNDDGLALGREVAEWVLEMDVRKRLGTWREAPTP
ncbi:MAG: phosphatase PAP2 family protein, partial [Bacteroidota bacterium]